MDNSIQKINLLLYQKLKIQGIRRLLQKNYFMHTNCPKMRVNMERVLLIMSLKQKCLRLLWNVKWVVRF